MIVWLWCVSLTQSVMNGPMCFVVAFCIWRCKCEWLAAKHYCLFVFRASPKIAIVFLPLITKNWGTFSIQMLGNIWLTQKSQGFSHLFNFFSSSLLPPQTITSQCPNPAIRLNIPRSVGYFSLLQAVDFTVACQRIIRLSSILPSSRP